MWQGVPFLRIGKQLTIQFKTFKVSQQFSSLSASDSVLFKNLAMEETLAGIFAVIDDNPGNPK